MVGDDFNSIFDYNYNSVISKMRQMLSLSESNDSRIKSSMNYMYT